MNNHFISKVYVAPIIRPFIETSEKLSRADWNESGCNPCAPNCNPPFRPNPPDDTNKEIPFDIFNIDKKIPEKNIDPADKSPHNPNLAAGTVLRKESFGGLLYNKNLKYLFQLNDTAYFFVKTISEKGVEDTITECGEIYDVPVELIRQDIAKILEFSYKTGIYE